MARFNLNIKTTAIISIFSITLFSSMSHASGCDDNYGYGSYNDYNSSAQSYPSSSANNAPISTAQDISLASGNVAPASAVTNIDGKSIWEANCQGCHATGAAGAPKIGDNNAWAPRIQKGLNTLVQNANQGFRGMPAKGGNSSLSDAEVAAAVSYMVSNSQ